MEVAFMETSVRSILNRQEDTHVTKDSVFTVENKIKSSTNNDRTRRKCLQLLEQIENIPCHVR